MELGSVHKEVLAPSTVDIALECRFFSSDEPCLVVVRSTELSVYRVGHSDSNNSNGSAAPQSFFASLASSSASSSSSVVDPSFLEHVVSYSLFGAVQSAAVAHLPKDRRDTLLLTFAPAKLAGG